VAIGAVTTALVGLLASGAGWQADNNAASVSNDTFSAGTARRQAKATGEKAVRSVDLAMGGSGE